MSYRALFTLVLLVLSPAASQAAVQLGYEDDWMRVFNCPLDASAFSDCYASSYGGTLLSWAFPGVTMTIFIGLFGALYGIGKYLFDICGGRRQSPNLFFPNRTLVAVYSHADLMRPRILCVVCAVMCLSGCIWGCAGTTQLRGALKDLAGSTERTVNSLQYASAAAVSQLQHVFFWDADQATSVEIDLSAGLPAQVLQMQLEVASQALQSIHECSANALQRYTHQFLWAPYLVFPAVTLLSALGLLVALFHCRRKASIAIFAAMSVGGLFVWGLHGALLMTGLRCAGGSMEFFSTNTARHPLFLK